LLRFGSKGGGDTLNIDKKGFNALKEQLIKEIMAYFKDQYLPSVVKIVKKEVIEEVNNLRAELHNFREETRKALKKQENELY
jgi:lipid II:glycine glycyltransferase (peptidoglycan interpeptide bridge formation enzyme)